MLDFVPRLKDKLGLKVDAGGNLREKYGDVEKKIVREYRCLKGGCVDTRDKRRLDLWIRAMLTECFDGRNEMWENWLTLRDHRRKSLVLDESIDANKSLWLGLAAMGEAHSRLAFGISRSHACSQLDAMGPMDEKNNSEDAWRLWAKSLLTTYIGHGNEVDPRTSN